MTTDASGGSVVPVFTLGDRLRKARSMTGLTTREFAEQLGVSHGTVTNAEKGNRQVRKITINQWSLVTRVPVEWLMTGQAPDDGRGPDDDGYAIRDSNPEPAD